MVTRNWVSRERDPTDSRAGTIKVTPDGQTILTEYVDKVEAAQREILAPLSSADQAAFMRYLRILLGMPAE